MSTCNDCQRPECPRCGPLYHPKKHPQEVAAEQVAQAALIQIRAWNTGYNRKTIAVDHPQIKIQLEKAFHIGVRYAKEGKLPL